MASSRLLRSARALLGTSAASASVFVRDVGHGLLAVTHNTLALLGLALAATVIFAAGRADLRHKAEVEALGWLQARLQIRQDPVAPAVAVAAPAPAVVVVAAAAPEPAATPSRPSPFDLKDLSRPQAAVAQWLAHRYRVAPEPVGALVKEAWQIGTKAGLDPTLILAIMAVESSFNPFAQSAVGAQGLMQVMTNVHNAKYDAFGGKHAAFDPMTNLRVGVEVLKECISRAGSLEAGLRYYVGAGNQAEDGGYAGRVLSEQNSLRQLVGGKSVPAHAPVQGAAAPPKPPEPAPTAADDAAHPANEQIALLLH